MYYIADGFESKYFQSLDGFAKHIADFHVDNDRPEPDINKLSVYFQNEIEVSKEGLKQFRKRVELYYDARMENVADQIAYDNETRPYSNGQNRY